ncbi:MAG: hypothetical protein K1X79_10240 [Oligoflexia bacterium]|nr:hypothetical protein [Oligoflexia bacterium]
MLPNSYLTALTVGVCMFAGTAAAQSSYGQFMNAGVDAAGVTCREAEINANNACAQGYPGVACTAVITHTKESASSCTVSGKCYCMSAEDVLEWEKDGRPRIYIDGTKLV